MKAVVRCFFYVRHYPDDLLSGKGNQRVGVRFPISPDSLTYIQLYSKWQLKPPGCFTQFLHGGNSMGSSQDAEQRQTICILTGVALGCAFLSKGVVSAPVWIALPIAALFIRRDLLKSIRTWMVPMIGLTLVGLHLQLDQIHADGVFTQRYFSSQIWGHWSGGGREGHEWWFLSYRFFNLYMPFVLLLPVGLYLTIRKRLTLLLPTAITLLVFVIFSSNAKLLYYHYFCPAYVFSAPIA